MFDSVTGYGPGLNTRGYAQVNYGTGDTPAEFFWNQIENKHESALQGKPVFKNVAFIRFHMGSGNILDRAVQEKDKHRYPRQWAAFEANQEQPPDGLPLDLWPTLSKEKAQGYKHYKIFTVEQLANAADTHIQECGLGAREDREKARKFVKAAESAAPIVALQAENEALQDKIALLEGQMRELMSLVEDKAAGKKKG